MGRKIGSRNKNKRFLLNRLQDMYGDEFHPIMRMAENAHKMQSLIEEMNETQISEINALKTATEAWEKVAAYTEPKLKSIEHTGMDGGAIEIKTFKDMYN